jgi:phosphohistidine phosphatase
VKLWLLRHGEAEIRAADDAARKLTQRGREQIGVMGALLRGQPLSAVYASPYVRAQQSARLLGLPASLELITVPWLVPETDPLKVLRELDEQPAILLVAHQPLLGELAGLLVNGHRQQPMALGTANLVELEGEALAAGLMNLAAVHRPGC